MITSKSQSWISIAKNFDSLVQNQWRVEPMVELVEHIAIGYSNRLYACTSLDTLIVSIYDDIDRFSEALHIKYDQHLKRFAFSYYGGHSASKRPEWKRLYNAEEGIEKFDEFTKTIKW